MTRVALTIIFLMTASAWAFPNNCFKHVTCPHAPPGSTRTIHVPPR